MLNLLFHHFQLVFESQIPKSAQIHWPFHKPSHLQLEDLQDLIPSPRVEVFSPDTPDMPISNGACTEVKEEKDLNPLKVRQRLFAN